MPEEEGMLLGRTRKKSLMSQIASDGRPNWKGGVSSEGAIRAFRARNREITFKNAEKKDRSKLGEKASITFKGSSKYWKTSGKDFRVWNMDETSISCEFGKRTKVVGSSQTHHGGFVALSLDSIGFVRKTLEIPSK